MADNVRKILIDMAVLAQGTRTGVFRVAHELVTRLCNDPGFEVFFTLTREREFQERQFDLRAGLRQYCDEHGLRAPFINPAVDPAFTDVDIYLSPFFRVPDAWATDHRIVKAVMAYDLIPILFPEYCQDWIIGLISDFYGQIGRDWLVFSISESTRRDLLSHRPDIPEHRVIVTHLGVDAQFRPEAGAETAHATLEKLGIPSDRPYVLSVATLEVRKNLSGVLAGFSRYLEQAGDERTMLVLAGMRGWKLEELERQLAENETLAERVVLTGFVEEQDLPVLYRNAALFVFMSHYEGFGLPPLEAMACGVPVISSDNSSLPEVIGDAGVMLPSGDVDGFAKALGELLSNPQKQEELATRSLDRAARFSWDRFGQRVGTALRQTPLSRSPALSIITICYNERRIRDTCESIRRQTFKGFEWIVIDGASDQETLATLEEYREHMAVFVSEPDQGRYDAMNKGIRASRGKYVLFLNGGDYLKEAETLSTIFEFSAPYELMDLFALAVRAPIVYGEVVARETGMFPHPMWKTGPQTHDIQFFDGNSLPHQATFILRELFDRYGLYDHSLKFAADYEWFIRVLVFHGIESQYLPVAVSVYNFDGVSSVAPAADAPHIVEIREVLAHYANPKVKSDWPSRSGRTVPSDPPRAVPEPAMERERETDKEMGKQTCKEPETVLDQQYADTLFRLAARRLSAEDLKWLIASCHSALGEQPETGGPVMGASISHSGDVARASIALLIARLHRSGRQHRTVTEEITSRRLLLRLRERLIGALQDRLTETGQPSVDPIELPHGHSLFQFTRLLGIQKPPLNEPDEYMLTQLALRAAGRQKYIGNPGAAEGDSGSPGVQGA